MTAVTVGAVYTHSRLLDNEIIRNIIKQRDINFVLF